MSTVSASVLAATRACAGSRCVRVRSPGQAPRAAPRWQLAAAGFPRRAADRSTRQLVARAWCATAALGRDGSQRASLRGGAGETPPCCARPTARARGSDSPFAAREHRPAQRVPRPSATRHAVHLGLGTALRAAHRVRREGVRLLCEAKCRLLHPARNALRPGRRGRRVRRSSCVAAGARRRRTACPASRAPCSARASNPADGTRSAASRPPPRSVRHSHRRDLARRQAAPRVSMVVDRESGRR